MRLPFVRGVAPLRLMFDQKAWQLRRGARYERRTSNGQRPLLSWGKSLQKGCSRRVAAGGLQTRGFDATLVWAS